MEIMRSSEESYKAQHSHLEIAYNGCSMPNNSPNKDDLEKLAEQIKKDQVNTNSAEKRVKVGVSFKKAVKKMGQTPPPKK